MSCDVGSVLAIGILVSGNPEYQEPRSLGTPNSRNLSTQILSHLDRGCSISAYANAKRIARAEKFTIWPWRSCFCTARHFLIGVQLSDFRRDSSGKIAWQESTSKLSAVSSVNRITTPAAHLIEVVVRFWRDFFKKFRATVALVHSEHHAF